MRFNFYSHGTLGQTWDWRSPHTTGCGGSESSHIELAQRLARLGHRVQSFAPIPPDCPPDPSGVIWEPEERLLTGKQGIWIVNRCPAIIPEIPESLGPVWLVCHDIAYEDFSPESQKRVTRILALCADQVKLLRRLYPAVGHKVCLSGNGVSSQDIMDLSSHGSHGEIKRFPHRAVYASAPERGLLQALDIHEKVREIIPDAELHVLFGFQNFDENYEASRFAQIIREVQEAQRRVAVDPGVVYRGRVSKMELYKTWLSSSVWLHPTVFLETNCITAQEAQSCGCIPVTNLIWGLKDNVKFGVGIDGDPRNCDLTRSRYVQEVASLMLNSERQEEIRYRMQTWALREFDWKCRAYEWEGFAFEDYASFLNPEVVEAVEEKERNYFVTKEMVEA